MSRNNNTLTWRITELERLVSDFDKRIDELLINEIPHLKETMLSLKTRINVLTTINIGAIILGILIAKYL